VDVDGTLITDHGAITDRVYRSLERVTDAGWEIIIATGRTLYAASSIIEGLPFVRYALFSNGSSIVDLRSGEILLLKRIPAEVVGEVVGAFRMRGAVPVLYNTDIFHQKMYYDTVEGACEYFVWYISHDQRSTRVDDIMRFTHDVQQIGTIAPKEVIFRIREDLAGGRAVPMSLPFESPHFGGKNHDYWFLQVVGEGVSKSIAIRQLAERLEIPPGRIVAVGDNYNDADMIEGADVGVAMGNAPDEIKRLAKVVVGTNNDSGLADVVEEVILSGKYFQ
jgi:hypothetical protein